MPRRDLDEQPQAPDWMEMFLDLQQRMLALQEQNAKANQLKENPNYVANSVFLKGNGEPWAKDLKCDVYLNSIHLNKTPLTQGEMDALNQLVPIDRVVVMKTDGSQARGRVTSRETSTGAIERLTLELPMKKDDQPQHYPSLEVLARQVAEQAQALATV